MDLWVERYGTEVKYEDLLENTVIVDDSLYWWQPECHHNILVSKRFIAIDEMNGSTSINSLVSPKEPFCYTPDIDPEITLKPPNDYYHYEKATPNFLKMFSKSKSQLYYLKEFLLQVKSTDIR